MAKTADDPPDDDQLRRPRLTVDLGPTARPSRMRWAAGPVRPRRWPGRSGPPPGPAPRPSVAEATVRRSGARPTRSRCASAGYRAPGSAADASSALAALSNPVRPALVALYAAIPFIGWSATTALMLARKPPGGSSPAAAREILIGAIRLTRNSRYSTSSSRSAMSPNATTPAAKTTPVNGFGWRAPG